MQRFLPLFLILFLLLPGPASAGETLTIGKPCLNQQCSFPQLEEFFRQAYARLGKEVRFRSLPAIREIDSADSGETDGCLLRTELVGRRYPGLVMVPYPLLHSTMVACAVRDDVKVHTAADLVGYRVGISRGGVAPHLICQEVGVVPTLLNNLSSGLKMLGEGRLDVILEEEVLLRHAAGEANVTLHCSEPLLHGYFYHWLNRKHADLAPALAEAFRAMAADGSMRKILSDYQAQMPDGVR